MMEHALRTVLPTGAWQLTVSVPGGRELAEKTFNPRLGIVGGISILGTTGIVRPFSHQALQAALRCALEVAAAAGAVPVVLVPGNIGRRAVHARFAELRDEQVVEVGNEWGFILDACRRRPVFTQWLLAGHPGKLAKFLEQDWDTHSSRSRSALEPLLTVAAELKLASGQIAEATTAEGVFAALSETDRRRLGDALARRIRDAVQAAYQPAATIGVWLCDMKGRELGFVPADARPAAQCTNPVVIAGCGPGAPDCVTPAAREAVMRAELLVGAPKVLALFPDAPGQRFEVHDAMGPGLDAAAVAQAAGRRVCVLVTGDPGVFSLATLVVKRLGAANCRLIPGISSVQVACARLGVPWARAKLISAHAALPAHTEQAALAQEEVVVLFGGKEQSWEWIAQAAEALRSSHQAWLCENLTLPSERVLLWPATPTPAAPGLVVLIRRENP
jgi:precorrin-6y C5,15-methyltransferase (decarboxylating) CbiE subunit